jgi:hypothetical protein
VPGEEWTVGVTLHHIAETYENSRRWVEAMARGDGVSETADMIDRASAPFGPAGGHARAAVAGLA